MVTWEAWDPPPTSPSVEPEDALEESRQPAYRLDRVVAGEFDDYLRRYAESVRDAGVPIMLRPFHEMNGFWYPWGGTVNSNEPSDVVAAWRHVHDLFEDVGAEGVTWVWSVNHRSLPDTPANQVEAYWPGREYVDWIGVSGFNFGTTSEVSTWRSLEEVVGDVLDTVADYDLPVILAEAATVHDGGDEGRWIREAFDWLLREQPKVDAVVWFERRVGDVRDFRVTSSVDALSAFREVVGSGAVLGAPRAVPTGEPTR
jgi:mannan endo-1,4-beta-mannosidase